MTAKSGDTDRAPRLPLNKTATPADFARLADELAAVDAVGVEGQHPMRRWEYAMALYTLAAWRTTEMDDQPHHLLDVGGGGSPLLDIIRQQYPRTGCDLVDPVVNYPIEASPIRDSSYDVVTAVSVLEHVPQQRQFLKACARHLRPGGLLFLTMDYWDCEGPDTAHYHWMRQRIYNRHAVNDLLTWARETCGLTRFGGTDWTYHGHHVFDYTFLSLALRKD